MVLPYDVAAAIGGAWLLLNNTLSHLNGTLKPPGDITYYPRGQLLYHASGHMSATIVAPAALNASDPDPDSPLDAPFAYIARRSLYYAGELSVWPGSNGSVGTLTHGPLVVASRPSWLGVVQRRNYVILRRGMGDRDVLHLWARDEEGDVVADIWWVRPEV
ncbi:hypothetical protein LEMA_P082950.1 [Plenodomus lingam JN3]|uniref:Lipocalin-like domain-containing protein n=2 Tax=Leptosphaeria maculans TaxID=5022 RepID=E5A611_LEPMJ|nr:hypothetical protein LEMA_P082950.1 [Plenodomus lingam JN3]CBX99056.1 hypothetical protein LEMA_P082950.1 [Plenodomus lingam JN3]